MEALSHITHLPSYASRITLAISALILTACGGGGDGGGASNTFSATLVTPTVESVAAQRIAGKALGARATCDQVPTGYSPIPNATVEFLNAEGAALATYNAATDECGLFSQVLPAGAVSIRAISAGNRDLIGGIDTILANGNIASTIPSNADYRIGFLTIYESGAVGFTVTDTLTNKAVIGLAPSAFTIASDGTADALTALRTAVAGEDASIVLVADASGSMDTNAYTDPATGRNYTRYELAAVAAHQFLDQKSTNDEVGLITFSYSSRVYFMDQATIDRLFELEDGAGNPQTYSLSDDGFTREATRMRFLVDAYNESSDVWRRNATNSNAVARHTDTPADLYIGNSYNLSGGTAFYDATILATEKLTTRTSPRKLVVAMTDGRNNSGLRDLDTVIASANARNTPVYTIGFEGGDEEDMTRLATDTGATYYRAESLQITDAYESIQTNIIYQYTGTPASSLAPGDVVELQLDVNGDGAIEASRSTQPN